MGRHAPCWSPLTVALVLALPTGCGIGTIEGPEPSSDGTLAVDGAGRVDDADARAAVDADRADGVDAAADIDASRDAPATPDARTMADARATPDAGTAPDARTTPDAAPSPDAATGPDCRNAAAWPAAWTRFEDEVLTLINQRRAAGATCGGNARPAVGPLRMDPALREAARCHSLDMAVNGYFGHDSQDGRSPWDRIRDAGYTAAATGENIAAGYADPAAAVQGWMTSPGHCNNIMAAGSNETGIGYAYQEGSPFGGYWTETFGRR